MSTWTVHTRGGHRTVEADKYIVTGDGHLEFFVAQANNTMFNTHCYSSGHWLGVERVPDPS